MPPPNAATAVPTAAPPGKGRVLVVDDDRLVLATVTQGLADAGYEVIDADNGDDAILLAREHRPALALLDIRMEGMSGFDVAETLRDKYGIPFMFLSAFSDEQTLATVKALGAVAYLVKPLQVGQIVPAVDAAFGQLSLPAGDAAAPRVQAERAVPAGGPLADPVPVAVGILMHRFSLARGPALERLRRQAQEHGLPLAQQAARVLAAVEDLSGG